MADAATSVENTTGRQCKKHTKIIGSLVFVIVLLMFLVAAIAVAFIFSRSKTINTQPKQKQSEHKEENNSTDENLRIGSFTGYPFMAALYSEKPHVLLCSCAIVTKHHLLTAANCFSVLFPRLFVRTGSPFWNEGGNVYQVENVAIHENYSATNFEKNLAIVKINTTIIFSGSINLAKIEKNVSWDEGYLTVMGWGRFKSLFGRYTQKLCCERFVHDHWGCSVNFK